MHRILVVEDETVIRNGLLDALQASGYEVTEAATGKSGLDLARHKPFDLILLDVMLPEVNGFTICETLRKEKNYTPIMMLTARGREQDIVEGLERGADDYLTKPFGLKELMARVQAALRRGRSSATFHESLKLGDVEINFSRMEISRHGQAQPMTTREGELVRYFLQHRGKIVTREELLLHVWQYATADLETRTVDIHMAKLRKKLETDPNHPMLIETVRGEGYKLAV